MTWEEYRQGGAWLQAKLDIADGDDEFWEDVPIVERIALVISSEFEDGPCTHCDALREIACEA